MPQVYVVYASHTGNTRRMAEAMAEGARELEGIGFSLRRAIEADAEDLVGADAIIIGAATRNAKVPPEMTSPSNA